MHSNCSQHHLWICIIKVSELLPKMLQQLASVTTTHKTFWLNLCIGISFQLTGQSGGSCNNVYKGLTTPPHNHLSVHPFIHPPIHPSVILLLREPICIHPPPLPPNLLLHPLLLPPPGVQSSWSVAHDVVDVTRFPCQTAWTALHWTAGRGVWMGESTVAVWRPLLRYSIVPCVHRAVGHRAIFNLSAAAHSVTHALRLAVVPVPKVSFVGSLLLDWRNAFHVYSYVTISFSKLVINRSEVSKSYVILQFYCKESGKLMTLSHLFTLARLPPYRAKRHLAAAMKNKHKNT